MSDVAEIIKTARTENEYSQRELAKRTGLSAGTISRIEAGLVSPTADTLISITRACGYEIIIKPIYKRGGKY